MWSEEERRALAGTRIEAMLREDEAAIKADYDEVVERAESGTLLGWPSEEENHMRMFDRFKEAATLVASRAFFVDDSVGQGLVPFADLFNHKSGGAHFKLVGDGAARDEDEKELWLQACRNIEAHNEMFNSFGDDHDNIMLLYKYGFAELDNCVRSVAFHDSDSFNGAHGCVLRGLYEFLIDEYDGLEFEIDQDGEMSNELLALLRYQQGEDTGEFKRSGKYQRLCEVSKKNPIEKFLEDGVDEEILFARLDPNRIVSMFQSRLERYCPSMPETYPIHERLEAGQLAQKFALQIKESYEAIEKAKTSASSHTEIIAESVIGQAAAHLVRAQELELLLRGFLRALGVDGRALKATDDSLSSGDDEEDDNIDENEIASVTRKRKSSSKLVAAIPCYAPTIYLKTQKKK
jgi:SET domain-containing protein 6